MTVILRGAGDSGLRGRCRPARRLRWTSRCQQQPGRWTERCSLSTVLQLAPGAGAGVATARIASEATERGLRTWSTE
ncbi:hypothetical protein OH76DRAFT_104781 [Lentinus brumalis]|uniref:Uncharacterized protein n=1 Tax=Lentinus brumalis TaxID=2498619 RepID=A0A371CQ45_9APHY|nr:hypothetical protein OH76DRAFT_104781 [Polyporus brumalis]